MKSIIKKLTAWTIVVVYVLVMILLSGYSLASGVVATFTKNNRTITIVTNGHIATEAQLTKLQNILYNAETLLCEDIRAESECKIWPIVKPFKTAAEYTNTKFIGDSLVYPLNAKFIDMDMREISEFYSDDAIKELEKPFRYLNIPVFLSRSLYGYFNFIAGIVENDPIVMERNKKFFYEIMTNESYNITFVVGDAHYCDLKDKLLQYNFKLKKQEVLRFY